MLGGYGYFAGEFESVRSGPVVNGKAYCLGAYAEVGVGGEGCTGYGCGVCYGKVGVVV